MNRMSMVMNEKASSFSSHTRGFLQRKCASCGNKTVAVQGCNDCDKKKNLLQRKFSMGAVNDPLEYEADRVADQVMSMPLHTSVANSPINIQRVTTPHSGSASKIPPSVARVLANSGHPMQTTLRQDMEQRFGQNFSQVRVHTGEVAEQSARDISARAYTIGRNIVFGSGEYTPQTRAGKQLLAHELTHVLQQSGGVSSSGVSVTSRSPTDEAITTTANSLKISDQTPNKIQRVPSPPSSSTKGHCGFGITTAVPGFVQSHFTGDYGVDYTTGCGWIFGNAWSSLWELYDSGDSLIDSNRETPFGGYTIDSSNVSVGTPGDGQTKWSLWYQVDHTQPWLTNDPDAYPHDWVEFDVYQSPIKNPNTNLETQTGPVVWQDNFTPAEDGASLSYNFSATDARTQTDSQTSTVSGTVGGGQSSSVGFEYEGLTGGFSRSLNWSATASISRSHSISISSSNTVSKTFTQPNLSGGVTYSIKLRPLYHLINGTVDIILHRNGVISGSGSSLSGAIRVLKGFDLMVTDGISHSDGDIEPLRSWSCDAKCNVEGTEAHCQNQRVEGSGTGANEEQACRAAKRDATQKAPLGCYARHCRCLNCSNR